MAVVDFWNPDGAADSGAKVVLFIDLARLAGAVTKKMLASKSLLRSNDFDANDFLQQSAGKPRQIYKQNDFGATIGGPVWIPKIYNGHNKTFFFFSYEGFRNRNGATNATATVPRRKCITAISAMVTAAASKFRSTIPKRKHDASGNVTRLNMPETRSP